MYRYTGIHRYTLMKKNEINPFLYFLNVDPNYYPYSVITYVS